jgi:hypothetical protein
VKEAYIKPEIKLEKLEPEALANPGSNGTNDGGIELTGALTGGCGDSC